MDGILETKGGIGLSEDKNTYEMTTAIDEYVLAKCEEILLSDPAIKRMNLSIIEAEVSFKKTLSPQQIKDYNKLEEMVAEVNAYSETLLYKHVLQNKSSGF